MRPLTRRARPRELARLQMVFQNPFSSLNPRRRVGDRNRWCARRPRRLLACEAARPGGELLEQVGLPAGAVRGYPHGFSRRTTAAHRDRPVLAPGPSVIVLDEPLASLDASASADREPSSSARPRVQLGLLLISHDLAIVRHVADAVAVMYPSGRIAEGRADARPRATHAPPVHGGTHRRRPARRQHEHAAGGAAGSP